MIPLCEMSRTDKSTETESRLVVSGGWGPGRVEELWVQANDAEFLLFPFFFFEHDSSYSFSWPCCGACGILVF